MITASVSSFRLPLRRLSSHPSPPPILSIRLMASSSAPPQPTPRALDLSPTEDRFVHLLDAYAQSCVPAIDCRIAGGWVRDKLLSLPSSDLDVALSTTSGYQFALGFVEYLKTQQIATGSVGRVAANPDQSKHLETGTTTILGLGCDFVGLRSETYTDTRIPQVQLGTPKEDALRRDLTINALFYNVHSREIEDHTGRGLSDLALKIARTPLAARQTFLDDPLRVLRCVRFASRFDLSIDGAASEAIRDPDIQAALQSKVSKERIGIEITKMTHDNPLLALSLIDSLGLHKWIFACAVDPPRQESLASAQILSQLLKRISVDSPVSLWFAAATCPFRDQTILVKNKPVPAVSWIISDSLKLSTELKTSVTNLFTAAKLLDPNMNDRGKLGMMLQLPTVLPWQLSIVWAIVMAILPSWKGSWNIESQQVFDRYMSFRDRIVEYNLPEDLIKPHLVDGKRLQSLLNIRPSPVFQIIKEASREWQFRNPQATSSECEAWLSQAWKNETQRAEWEQMAKKKS